jgi:hypothetical protein
MPHLEVLQLERCPSLEPLCYPGAVVGRSCLLVGSWLYRMDSRAGRPVGDWQVDLDGGRLEGVAAGRRDLELSVALQRLGVAPLAERAPVIAVGSNAAPGQLIHKLGNHAVSDVVPLTLVRVGGLAVGHSAHVSVPGYVPYVPIAAPAGVEREFYVLWLDDEQLRRINATEPNHRTVTVRDPRLAAVFESGERLPGYAMYRGRWGAFRLGPDEAPLLATTQPEILAVLATHAWFRWLVPSCRDGPEAIVASLAADADTRQAVRFELARRGMVARDGLPDRL